MVSGRYFSPGDLIEVCPLIFLGDEEAAFVKMRGVLQYYVLDLLQTGETAVMLGLGFVYNHSDTPNAEIEYTAGDDFVRFVAVSAIHPGDEIVYDYWFGGPPVFMPAAVEIDHVFSMVGNLLLAEKFDIVDAMLRTLGCAARSTEVLRAFITATRDNASRLPSRSNFVSRVRAVMVQRGEFTPDLFTDETLQISVDGSPALY